MRYGIDVPNFDEFYDPRRVADLARRAEDAGWDGLFVWDHVLFHGEQHEIADPWVQLTAVALATERIRFGTLVTPVARRRPGTLARQTTTLDRLSGGRLVLGVGLGSTLQHEFGTWGESTEPRVVAERLDEGLAVLAGLWSGERVDAAGPHLPVTDATFLPVPVQRPRPPVWVAGMWPHRAPLRRAARWDGVVPLVQGDGGDSRPPTAAELREIVAVVTEHRTGPGPFDVVAIGGTKPDQPAAAKEHAAEIEAAGATWWVEGFIPAAGEYDAAVRRIEAGPPR